MVRKKVRTKSALFTIGNATILVRVKNQLLRGLQRVFRLSKYEYYYEKNRGAQRDCARKQGYLVSAI